MQPEVPSYSTLYQLPSFPVMATAAFWRMVIRMEYPVPGPLRIRTPVPLMTPSAATPVVEAETGTSTVSSLADSSGVSSAAAACRAAFAVEPACFRSLLLAAASSAVSISSSAVMAAALTSAEKRAA